jgi:hypothetical protein
VPERPSSSPAGSGTSGPAPASATSPRDPPPLHEQEWTLHLLPRFAPSPRRRISKTLRGKIRRSFETDVIQRPRFRGEIQRSHRADIMRKISVCNETQCTRACKTRTLYSTISYRGFGGNKPGHPQRATDSARRGRNREPIPSGQAPRTHHPCAIRGPLGQASAPPNTEATRELLPAPASGCVASQSQKGNIRINQPGACPLRQVQ